MKIGSGTMLIHCERCGFRHLKAGPCQKRLTVEEHMKQTEEYLEGLRKFQERSREVNFEIGASVKPGCPKCGLEFTGTMSYTCGLSECPSFGSSICI